eukprot:TRINITY_DN55524_c0_g1_i1.p1 TRINITY_DN55524_c0_g1~~TRINITY_DN55524_c0_g1_i1.p1  ORF type:complete len:1216 (+),score=223.01 TRINITY_DN55524_c0_g1_i1:71-3718(+)
MHLGRAYWLGFLAGWVFPLSFSAAEPLVRTQSNGRRLLKVAMVLSDSPADITWNYRHNMGRLSMVDTLLQRYGDLDIESEFKVVRDMVSDQEDAIKEVLDNYGAQGWHIVIAASFGFQASAVAAAARFPDTSWVHIGGYMSGTPNFATAWCRVYQARYVTGIAAASQSNTQKIGFIAAFPFVAQVVRGFNALTLGARSASSNASVLVNFVHSWYDNARNLQAAEWLMALGCDVLAGHTNDRDVFSFFTDRGLKAVGYHNDLRQLYGDRMVTSAYYTWGPMYTSFAELVLSGQNIPPAVFAGMEERVPAVGTPTQYVPPWARERIAAAESLLATGADTHPMHGGSAVIFCGPMNDEYGVRVLQNASDCLTKSALLEIDWFVEGVEDLGRVWLPSELCEAGNEYRWIPQGQMTLDNSRHRLGSSAPGKRKLRFAFSCTPCGPGHFTPVAGSTRCAPCPAGTYSVGSSPASNATQCVPCPEGFFAPGNGSQACQECPEGRTNHNAGSTSCPVTKSWAERHWWVILLVSLAGLVLVAAPPLACAFGRQRKRMLVLIDDNALAETCAESIAAMRLEEVAWIHDIDRPNRIQQAFTTIVDVLSLYRSFLPRSVLQQPHRGAATEPDEELSSTTVPPPCGTAGVCFTDIIGSTALWEASPESMETALVEHNKVIRAATRMHDGYEVKTIGDSFMLVFQDPVQAVLCALQIQTDLLDVQWPQDPVLATTSAYWSRRTTASGSPLWHGLALRVGVACGEVRDEVNPITQRVDYRGPTVNLAARCETGAPHGMVLVSNDFCKYRSDSRLQGVDFIPRSQNLKGLGRVQTFVVTTPKLQRRLAPAETPCNLTQSCRSELSLSGTPSTGRGLSEWLGGAHRRSPGSTFSGPSLGHHHAGSPRKSRVDEPRFVLQLQDTMGTVAVVAPLDGARSYVVHPEDRRPAPESAVLMGHYVNRNFQDCYTSAQRTQGNFSALVGSHAYVDWGVLHKRADHQTQAVGFAKHLADSGSSLGTLHIGIGSGALYYGNCGNHMQRNYVVIGVPFHAAGKLCEEGAFIGATCLAAFVPELPSSVLSGYGTMRTVDVWRLQQSPPSGVPSTLAISEILLQRRRVLDHMAHMADSGSEHGMLGDSGLHSVAADDDGAELYETRFWKALQGSASAASELCEAAAAAADSVGAIVGARLVEHARRHEEGAPWRINAPFPLAKIPPPVGVGLDDPLPAVRPPM